MRLKGADRDGSIVRSIKNIIFVPVVLNQRVKFSAAESENKSIVYRFHTTVKNDGK